MAKRTSIKAGHSAPRSAAERERAEDLFMEAFDSLLPLTRELVTSSNRYDWRVDDTTLEQAHKAITAYVRFYRKYREVSSLDFKARNLFGELFYARDWTTNDDYDDDDYGDDDEPNYEALLDDATTFERTLVQAHSELMGVEHARRSNPEGDEQTACDRAREKAEKTCMIERTKLEKAKPKKNGTKGAKVAKASEAGGSAGDKPAKRKPAKTKAARAPKGEGKVKSAGKGKASADDHKYGLYDTPEEAHREAETLARTVIPTEKFKTLPQFVRALAYKPRPAKPSTPRSTAAPATDVPIAGVSVATTAAIEAPLTAVGATPQDIKAAASVATAEHIKHPEDKLFFAVTANGDWAVAHGKRDADVMAKLKAQGFKKATLVTLPALVTNNTKRDDAYANLLDEFAERFCGRWTRSKASQVRKSVAQVDAALEQDRVPGPSLIPDMVAMPDQPEVTYAAPVEAAGPPVVPEEYETPAAKPPKRGGRGNVPAEPKVKPAREPRTKPAAAASSGQGAATSDDLQAFMAAIEKSNAAALGKVADKLNERFK